MQQILLVKTTSLGDVIHCLPAVTDLAAHFPGVRLDWVVEEPYARMVTLHPAVTRALPVAVRRWRKSLTARGTWQEISSFKRQLAVDGYDRVIDAQGLVKSALLARMAKGELHGLDASSAREAIATGTYHHRHHVPWTLDAVTRNRRLFGAALGYTPRGEPRYGIQGVPADAAWLPRIAGSASAIKPYCVLLTGTSDAAKLWPEEEWLACARLAAGAGLTCVLPHGSSDEEARVTRLARALGEAGVVAPAQPLTELARVLAGAALVIGLDTGLTHLGAALERPTVGIYTGTRPSDTGVIARRARSLGNLGESPTAAAVWAAARELMALPERP